MQGVTRDNAIATGLWRPEKDIVEDPEMPHRDDPGFIESPHSPEDALQQTERSSGNDRDRDGNAVELW